MGKSKHDKQNEDDSSDKRESKCSIWNEKIPKFTKGEMKHSLAAETSFTIRFPEYRETYIKKHFKVLKKVMESHGIAVELDTNNGTLCVKTTQNTWDPYSIMIARDVIKLLSRHVEITDAIRVFNEGIASEVMEIKKMVRKEITFVKRRERLCGKDNATLISLQKLTNCKIIVQGHTVSIIGPYEGLAQAMKVVKGCMENNHPLHLLNSLLLKTQMKTNPKFEDKDWSELIPDYAKTSQKKKKKTFRKEYNPLPPAPRESKVDKLVEEGEFFVDKKMLKRTKPNAADQKEKSKKIQAEKRSQQYIAPVEKVNKKRKIEETEPTTVDMENLKKKVKKQKKKLSAA